MPITHDRYGAGPALVLLHGIGSHRGVWDPVVPALARERTVLALGLPGFAGLPLGGIDPTPAGQAANLSAWFVEQGLERPHVAGNSMGGAIALELARLDAVASATAVSPIGFWTPRERAYGRWSLVGSRALAARLQPAAPRLVRSAAARTLLFGQIYGRPWRLTPEAALAAVDAFVDAPGFDATREALDDYAIRPDAALREAPLTIAWGTRDVLLIPRQARRARRLLPGARHAWLPGCGHVPFADDPATVAAVLLAGSAAVRE
jgi:pimeloyl-ACP methyl ester carboxylesterase